MKVTIYIRDHCSFCDRALKLLREKNINMQVINANHDETARAQMIEKTGGRTFPQIIIGNKPIGGCDNLYALEATGQLDTLLQEASQ